MLKDVGSRIRQGRIATKMSMEEVGNHLGIGKQAIYKYETGKTTNIPIVNIEKMAELFHLSPAYLAGWKDEQVDSEVSMTLKNDEIHLVTLYRGAEPLAKKIAIETLENNQKQDTESERMA